MFEPIPAGQVVDPEKLEIHPAADVFPLAEDADFEALVEDIRKNGLKNPIVLDAECRVLLDGRRRLKACRRAGAELRFVRHTGPESPLDLVISLNVRRRQMNESQRAMVAARLMPQLGAEAAKRRGVRKNIKVDLPGSSSGQAREQAAAMLNVSPSLVQRAVTVLKSGNAELIQGVDRGELAVTTAVSRLRPAQPTPQPAPPGATGEAMLLLWGPARKMAEFLPAIESSGLRYQACQASWIDTPR